MAVCRKCNTVNEEGLTRCKSCNAILPVKIGSKSEQRWERTRRAPDLVGMTCPSCGATNPYTRFKCSACGAFLRKEPKKTGMFTKVLVAVGIALVVILTVLSIAMRGGEEPASDASAAAVQTDTGGYVEEGGYPEGGYANGGYPEGGYANGGYPEGGYPEGGYANGGYAEGGDSSY